MHDGRESQLERFTPGPDTARTFRDALGRFPTGVCVVTTRSEIGPIGITANSFASVSLDPPLVLWSPARASRRFDAFAGAERFAIHVMGADHDRVCAGFSRDGQAFPEGRWSAGPDGLPLLEDCLARFECTRTATHDGGDHAIVVGRVTAASLRKGQPLVFFSGRYGRFEAA